MKRLGFRKLKIESKMQNKKSLKELNGKNWTWKRVCLVALLLNAVGNRWLQSLKLSLSVDLAYHLFFNFPSSASFCLFSLFPTSSFQRKCRFHRDSNSDRRKARWPLDRHHGPTYFTYFVARLYLSLTRSSQPKLTWEGGRWKPQKCFFKKRANLIPFFIYFCLFKHALQFLQQKGMFKSVHPVYGAGIRTHDLWIMSLLP